MKTITIAAAAAIAASIAGAASVAPSDGVDRPHHKPTEHSVSRKPTRQAAGDVLPLTPVTDIFGAQVSRVPQAGWIHLQFRRFAGCPIWNRRLRRFANLRAR